MELTSLDYANLIAWIAKGKYGVSLGKTQLQKLLFIFFGLALAKYDALPFKDDSPKAFPFGPVFPRSYKRYDGSVKDISQQDRHRFMESIDLLKLATWVTDSFCRLSAMHLSEWSHRDGAPWKKTVYRDDMPAWGREMDSDEIKKFFSTDGWMIGL